MLIKLDPIMPKKGLADVEKAFAALSKGVSETAAEGVRFMSWYPPKTGGSYRRTNMLRNSWSYKIKSGNKRIEGIVASNANIAGYNEDVQGEKQQAKFAQIGWRNTDDLDKELMRDFPKRMNDIISKVF